MCYENEGDEGQTSLWSRWSRDQIRPMRNWTRGTAVAVWRKGRWIDRVEAGTARERPMSK
jgi:hypothetical protein